MVSNSFKLTLLMCFCCLLAYSQEESNMVSMEFYKKPWYEKEHGLKSITIYQKSKATIFSTSIPKKIGRPLEVTNYNKDGLITEILRFNTVTNKLLSTIKYNYLNNDSTEIVKKNKRGKIQHAWLICDSLLIDEKQYNAFGNLIKQSHYEYKNDSLYNRIAISDYINHSLKIILYDYNDDNKLIKYSELLDNELLYYQVNTYNEDGKLVGFETFDGDSLVDLTVELEDVSDTLNKSVLVSDENSKSGNFKANYTYDTDGKILLFTKINRRGKQVFSAKYFYDDASKLIEIKRKGRMYRNATQYAYHKSGKLKNIRYYQGSFLVYKVEYIRKDDGTIDKEIFYYPTDDKMFVNSYVYTYF